MYAATISLVLNGVTSFRDILEMSLLFSSMLTCLSKELASRCRLHSLKYAHLNFSHSSAEEHYNFACCVLDTVEASDWKYAKFSVIGL